MGKKCIICLEAAPYGLYDYHSHWGPKPKKQERKELWNEGMPQRYCRPHFLEAYKEIIDQFQGRFIFFKEILYFSDYIYLSMDRLRFHPAHYTEEELNRISELLDSMEVKCKRCQINETKVLLMHIQVIENTVAPPLIKKEDYLELNESLCIECFIDFLANLIQKHRKDFSSFSVNIPYNQKGIYLWEE